ncbi:MAG: metalloregulator ArsR/SmtB family transcription factor [Reichenbachiella sp.]|uniref:ArsR/SmtB family transcription factor n=1 Tax=Reichenbachiella sp. TaxID=2184521 RepID=UPI00326671F4
MSQPVDTDKVFSALSDGNRRKIIELLHNKEASIIELAEFFPISFQALSKHVNILESAQILNKEKKGKYRVLSLNQKALQTSLEWISYYSNFWNESFDKLNVIIGESKTDGAPE